MARNEVVLRINPFDQTNEIILNGQMISSYSMLNNFVKAPFMEWAYRFYQSVESELNDEFSVTVTAEGFETKFLEDMAKCYPGCKNFRKGSFPIDIDYEDRVEEFVNLTGLYGSDPRILKTKMNIVTDTSVSMQELQQLFDKYQSFRAFRGGATFYSPLAEVRLEVKDRTDERNKAIYLASDMRSAELMAQNIPNSGEQNLILVYSEQPGVVWRDNCYFWGVKKNMFCRSLELFLIHTFVIPQFVEEFRKQQLDVADMENDEAELYQKLDKVNPIVTAGKVPTLEKGDSHTINCSVIPRGFKMPTVVAKSENEAIASVRGLTLTAVGGGTTYINLYTLGNVIPFAKLPVHVEAHNNAAELRFVNPVTGIGVGDVKSLRVESVPAGADDLRNLYWKSSNPQVLSVDQKGNLKGISSGNADITVSGSKANVTVRVYVKEKIRSISLNYSQVNMFMGEEVPVEAQTTPPPESCFDSSCIWETSDSQVAVVEKGSNGEMMVVSTGIGNCILTCRARDGNSSVSCDVNVQSSFYRNERSHKFLIASLITCILALFFAVGGIASALFAIPSIICALNAMKKNPEDKAYAILFIVVAVFAVILGLTFMSNY